MHPGKMMENVGLCTESQNQKIMKSEWEVQR
jgi:hypothetical protein